MLVANGVIEVLDEAIATASHQQTGGLQVPAGLVSILVPCWGQLEHTRLVVPSVLRYSRQPYEVIFVDVGSLDGTYEFLNGVAAAAPVRIEVVRTLTDLGFADAIREALRRSRGDYLVLLNNDTVVTEAWLDQLIALANVSHCVGLVGPMSNYAAAPQLVEQVPYSVGPRDNVARLSSAVIEEEPWDLADLERFAKQWREQHAGKWLEVEHLGGFCVLVKRQVLNTIYPLMTELGLDLFDTNELCQKAREAGYVLAVCRDLFIHQFDTRTRARAPKGS